MKTQGTLVARRKTEGQPHQTHGEVGGLRGAGPGGQVGVIAPPEHGKACDSISLYAPSDS